MNKLFIAVMMALMAVNPSLAAERKPNKAIDVASISSDTYVTFKVPGDKHVALAWWIPIEYWEFILSRDATTSESAKKAILDALSGFSVLAVVQADIAAHGDFKFYSKKEIKDNMTLSYSSPDGQIQRLSLVQSIDPFLEEVLVVLKPIVGAAMGKLGSNMHFYVLNDRAKSAPRLLDPYQNGQIGIQLASRDNLLIDASIEMPLNALFIPRKCPNGKDAHISWKYCPWSGTKLEE